MTIEVRRQQPGGNQTVKKVNAAGVDISSRFQNVCAMKRKGLKANFYGPNGSGKTTLACTAPKPLLIVGFEDGTESVKNVKGVDFFRVQHTSELGEVSAFVRDGKIAPTQTLPYETVVIDTVTSLQDMILKELMGWDDMPVQLGWGVAGRDQYIARSEKTKELLRLFTRFDGNVILLAQQKDHTKKEEGDPSEVPEGVLKTWMASAVGTSACQWIHDNVSCVCQTFTRQKEVFKEIANPADPKNPKKIKMPSKEREYCLRTSKCGTDMFAGKIQTDREVQMPEVIVDPSYDKLMMYLRQNIDK